MGAAQLCGGRRQITHDVGGGRCLNRAGDTTASGLRDAATAQTTTITAHGMGTSVDDYGGYGELHDDLFLSLRGCGDTPYAALCHVARTVA